MALQMVQETTMAVLLKLEKPHSGGPFGLQKPGSPLAQHIDLQPAMIMLLAEIMITRVMDTLYAV